MKVIEQIKKDLSDARRYRLGDVLILCKPESIAVLVEYYEAAEAWFLLWGLLDSYRPDNHLKKARAELEKEV